MTIGEGQQQAALEWAQQSFASLEQPLRLAAFYVSRDEDPIEALKRVRAFLYRALDSQSKHIALAVVALDRILETLGKCEIERHYER
jgi:hypothetical protein